jgi:hypothetical protein
MPIEGNEPLTLNKYAEYRKCEPAAVKTAIDSGRLLKSVKRTGKIYQIDPKLADIEWEENTNGFVGYRAHEAQTDDSDGDEVVTEKDKIPSFGISRAKREFHQAALVELEHAELAGKLVPIDKVRKDGFRLARLTRDAMLNIADRCSADLAAELDPFQVHKRLNMEIRAALESLATVINDGPDIPDGLQ